jgi:hypothetical protein
MAAPESNAREILTLEQFRAMEESDAYLFELDDGVLVREPRPQRPHGAAVVLLGHHLASYALEHGPRVASCCTGRLGRAACWAAATSSPATCSPVSSSAFRRFSGSDGPPIDRVSPLAYVQAYAATQGGGR